MTLAEYVRGLADDQLIKIGCVNGSSYIFAGAKGDLDMVRLNSDLFAKAAEGMYMGVKTWVAAWGWTATRLKAQTGVLKKRIKEFRGYKTLGDREVVEVRHSIAEANCLIVAVTGYDVGKEWLAAKEHAIELNCEEGMRNLAVAIYKQGSDHLVHLLEGVIKECKYLEADPYGILSDPQGVIDACRKRAGISKVVRGMIKEPGKRVRFAMLGTGYDALSHQIGEYVELQKLTDEIAVAQDMYAMSGGKEYNCDIGDTSYYGTIVFFDVKDGIMQDVSKKSEQKIRAMIKGDV